MVTERVVEQPTTLSLLLHPKTYSTHWLVWNTSSTATVGRCQEPVKKVKFLKEDNEQTRVLNAEEEKLYLLAASHPLQGIATLMLETGNRPEEVHRIRCENVHNKEGYVLSLWQNKGSQAQDTT